MIIKMINAEPSTSDTWFIILDKMVRQDRGEE